jgi:ribosomal protein S6
MGMAIGEEDGLFMSAFGLSASTEESATQVENLVRGMVALGSLSATEKPELAKLANAVKISRDGRFVAIQFEMESQEMISVMETSTKRKMKRRKMKELE